MKKPQVYFWLGLLLITVCGSYYVYHYDLGKGASTGPSGVLPAIQSTNLLVFIREKIPGDLTLILQTNSDLGSHSPPKMFDDRIQIAVDYKSGRIVVADMKDFEIALITTNKKVVWVNRFPNLEFFKSAKYANLHIKKDRAILSAFLGSESGSEEFELETGIRRSGIYNTR